MIIIGISMMSIMKKWWSLGIPTNIDAAVAGPRFGALGGHVSATYFCSFNFWSLELLRHFMLMVGLVSWFLVSEAPSHRRSCFSALLATTSDCRCIFEYFSFGLLWLFSSLGGEECPEWWSRHNFTSSWDDEVPRLSANKSFMKDRRGMFNAASTRTSTGYFVTIVREKEWA